MKCPHCQMEILIRTGRNYTAPFFIVLMLLLVVFLFVGIRMRGEREALRLKIADLEKKVAYYESTLLQYQKTIEQFIQKLPEKNN